MSVQVFRTGSEEETIALGEKIGRDLALPAVVLLIGELGAGKTTIAKGIVKGLGAGEPEDVSSPTFTLIHEFGDKSKVYHLDLYRIEQASQVLALGIDDLLDQDAVLLVEWGERFPELWPAGRVEIELKWAGETAREIVWRTKAPSRPRG
jgi:tRNA threonylcarbamoyladenosine biosynthesis protein TsaE